MTSPISAVIFDHDGTLVGTESDHYRIWKTLLAESEIDLEEETFLRDCNGRPSIDNARLFIERYGMAHTAEVLVAEKEQRAQKFFSTHLSPLMPSAEDCISACVNANLRLAIATGANISNLEYAIQHRRIYQDFSVIATADQVSANKPAPDVYHLAMHRLGLEADQCIAVEDSPTGIASAKAAGLYCIAIPSPYSQYQDLSQADTIVSNLLIAAEKIISLS